MHHLTPSPSLHKEVTPSTPPLRFALLLDIAQARHIDTFQCPELFVRFPRNQELTDSQVGEMLVKRQAVFIDAVALQSKQLTYVPGHNVTGDLHRPAGVVFIINLNDLQTTSGGCQSKLFSKFFYCKSTFVDTSLL